MIYSKQRELILAAVRDHSDHPTAEEVYALLKPENPNLSLGTVYRNLNQLSKAGMLKKVTLPESADRFDDNLEEHYHMVCRHCGHVTDIPLSEGVLETLQNAAAPKGWKSFSEFRILLYGLCGKCAQLNGSSL